MKRVLIIKMSSLGDVIHTLPALTDANSALADVQFDWVVEEKFAEIPAWHPAVNTVIPVAIRRWRKHVLNALTSGEWHHFKRQLQAENYHAVIDAQGLIKSGFLTWLTAGSSFGLDKHSAREPLAARFYQNPVFISKEQHAVTRTRQLFARVLDYALTDNLDYGIKDFVQHKTGKLKQQQMSPYAASNISIEAKKKPILFFHGTTWDTKHWPEHYWIELAKRLTTEGYRVLLPWGSEAEYQRALRIQQQSISAGSISLLPRMDLSEMAGQLLEAAAVIAVDTGLAHLAAALDIPAITLFGPTNPGLTGPCGAYQEHLLVDYSCAPCLKKHCAMKIVSQKPADYVQPACFSTLTPARVHKSLTRLLSEQGPSSEPANPGTQSRR